LNQIVFGFVAVVIFAWNREFVNFGESVGFTASPIGYNQRLFKRFHAKSHAK